MTQQKDSEEKNRDSCQVDAKAQAILFTNGTEFDLDRQKMLFEQYKILGQASDQLASRRQVMNGFFLSLNSFMLAGMGFIFKESFDLYVHEHKVVRLMVLALVLGVFGLVININWSNLLASYGKLIRGQVRVLQALERHIPASVVTVQETFHGREFHSLSALEKNIAHTFQAIYIVSALGAHVLMLVRLPIT
jgi:hypothetical protein